MGSPAIAGSVLATEYLSSASRRPHYGAWVAVDSFYSAILRHGDWDRYEFYVTPAGRAEATLRARDIGGERARVVPFAELKARSGDLGLTAWHSADLRVEPFYVRSHHATKPFPITLVHHTVSYQRSLHNVLLPLLLADTMPCDSIVCPSAAARRAVEALLDEVAHRFNERHGTRLRFSGRLDTIPIGVDTEALRPTEQALSRRSLSLPEEPLTLQAANETRTPVRGRARRSRAVRRYVLTLASLAGLVAILVPLSETVAVRKSQDAAAAYG